jgi:hypothetical protein
MLELDDEEFPLVQEKIKKSKAMLLPKASHLTSVFILFLSFTGRDRPYLNKDKNRSNKATYF